MDTQLPVTIVVAMNENRYIGKDNQLMWRLPSDLKRFKELTTSSTIIMGRKTHESIGRPLPERKNIVVTRNHNFRLPNCAVEHSLDAALAIAQTYRKPIFIIGGGEIYREALPLTHRIEMTVVDDGGIVGDVQFPVLSLDQWSIEDTKHDMESKQDEFPFSYVTYKRRKPA